MWPTSRTHGYCDSPLDHDRPISTDAMRDAYVKARRAAGREDLRFHDLRSTALTMLAQQGATVRELMAAAGHSTAIMAMHYQRLSEDDSARSPTRWPPASPRHRRTPHRHRPKTTKTGRSPNSKNRWHNSRHSPTRNDFEIISVIFRETSTKGIRMKGKRQ